MQSEGSEGRAREGKSSTRGRMNVESPSAAIEPEAPTAVDPHTLKVTLLRPRSCASSVPR